MIILEKYLTLKNIFSNERVLLSKKFCRFSKFITNQKINLVFAVVGMMHSTRKWYRANVDNYVEIYIKADIKKTIKLKKKKIYHKKKIGDVVGTTIKPELPKQPDIVINSNFKKSSDFLANNLVRKILKIV